MVGDVPLLGNSEIGGKIVALAEHEKFNDIDDLSAAIVETTEGAKTVIEDLRRALTTLDAKPLILYSRQLEKINDRLVALLKRGP